MNIYVLLPLLLMFANVMPAYATPYVKVKYDRLELGVMATYVDYTEYLGGGEPPQLDKPAGTVVSDRYVGSIFSSEVPHDGVKVNSNIVHVRSWIANGMENAELALIVTMDDDLLNEDFIYPPIGTTAMGYAQWNAIFSVKGEGVSWYAGSLNSGNDIIRMCDLTTGSNVGSNSLYDGHTYSLALYHDERQTGYVGSALDEDSVLFFGFSCNAVKVPEPSAILSFITGLAGFGGVTFRMRRRTA